LKPYSRDKESLNLLTLQKVRAFIALPFSFLTLVLQNLADEN